MYICIAYTFLVAAFLSPKSLFNMDYKNQGERIVRLQSEMDELQKVLYQTPLYIVPFIGLTQEKINQQTRLDEICLELKFLRKN